MKHNYYKGWPNPNGHNTPNVGKSRNEDIEVISEDVQKGLDFLRVKAAVMGPKKPRRERVTPQLHIRKMPKRQRTFYNAISRKAFS